MQSYELMIIYKPLLFEDIKKSTISKLEKTIKKLKGTLKERDNIGKKLLAFPIKNFKEGYYVQYDLKLEASDIAVFKNELHLSSDILRFLLIDKSQL